MTKEQLEALEAWIESIVEEKDRASGLNEVIRRRSCKDDVLEAFGLAEARK